MNWFPSLTWTEKHRILSHLRGVTLDRVLIIAHNEFKPRELAPIGSAYHSAIQILPKNLSQIYSPTAHIDQRRVVRIRDISTSNFTALRDVLSTIEFILFNGGDLSDYVDTFSDYLIFCYDTYSLRGRFVSIAGN